MWRLVAWGRDPRRVSLAHEVFFLLSMLSKFEGGRGESEAGWRRRREEAKARGGAGGARRRQ
jgi:hypothetical protein